MPSSQDCKTLRTLLLEQLEDRTLFDAATLIADGASHALTEACEPLSCESQFDQIDRAEAVTTQVVFVDERIDNTQELLRDLDISRRLDVEIIYVNSASSGIEQMTRALLDFDHLSAVHVLSHGEGGGLQIGSDWLNADSIDRHAEQLRSWQTALAEDADLLIYGCELGSNEAGRMLMSDLSRLTQADIAASDDLTGDNRLGGDWMLEVSVGDINEQLIFAPLSGSWSGLLAVEATRDIVTVQDAASSASGTVSLSDNAALIDVTSSNTPERVVQMLQRVWTFNETSEVGAATFVFDISGLGGLLGVNTTDFALIRSTQENLVAGTTDVLLASGFDSVNGLVYFHQVNLNDGEYFALATKVETNSFSIAPTTTTLEDTPVNIGVVVDPALTNGGTLQDIVGTDIGFRSNTAGATPTNFVIPAGTMGIRVTGYSTRNGNTAAIDSQNDDYQTLYATIDLTTETSDGFNAYIIDRGVARSDQFGWEDAPLGASILTGGGIVSGDTSNNIDPTFQIVDGVLQIIENHGLQTAYHVEFLTTIESSSNYLGVESEVRDQGDTTDIVVAIDPDADFIVITEADAATDGGDYRVEYKGFGRIVLDLTTLRASGTLVAERGEGPDRNTAYSFTNYDASNATVGSIQSSSATIVGDVSDTVSSNNDLQFFINAGGDLVIRRDTNFANVFNSLFSVEFYERLPIGSQANALATSFDRQFFTADVSGPLHTLNFDVPDGAVLGIMNLSMNNEEADDVNENVGAGYAIIDLTSGVTSGSLYNIRVGGTVDFVAWSEVMFGTEFFDANGDADPNSSMESNHTLISQFVDEYSGNAALNLVNNPDGTQSVTFTSYNNQTAASYKNYWTAAQVQWYGIQPFELSGYPANGSFDKGQLNTTSGNWEVSIEDIAAGLTYIPGAHYSGFDPINVSFRLGQETESTTVIVQAVADTITFSAASLSGVEDTPLDISLGLQPVFVDQDGSETLTSIQLGGFADGHGITDGTFTFIATPGNDSIDITGWDQSNMTYLPAADAVGTFDLDVIVTVQDVGGGVTDSRTISETLSITLTNVNDDPFPTDDFYITAQGDVLTTVLGTNGLLHNDSDPDVADSLSVTTTPVSGPSNGLLVINTNGTFSYTPTGGFTGTDSFTYEVTDGNGGVAVATARILVAPPILCDLTDLWDLNSDPHAEADNVGLDVTTAAMGGASFGAFGNDTFNNIPAFADLMAAGHESLSVNFVWDSTPEPGAATGGTGTLTFTFDEAVVNPELNLDRLGDSFMGVSNSALLTLLTPGLSLERLSGPSHFDVDAIAGTIQRTPNQVLGGTATEQSSMDPTLGSAAGSVRIVGTVTTISFQIEGIGPEGQGFDDFELSWCVNSAPSAIDDADTTAEETTINLDVLSNDSDSLGEPFIIVATTDPTSGTISVNADMTIDYTPNVNYYGVDSFTYTIQDANGGMSTATVTLTVTNTQDAPTALPDSATTDEDVPVIVDVLNNDVDPDPDTLSVTTASATNGDVVINPDGTITYTPTAEWSGTDTITYSMSDGNGGTDTTTVTVTVAPVADAPTSASFTRVTTEDTEYVFTLADFLFADNDAGDIFTEFRIDSVPTAGTLSYDGTDVSSVPLTIVPADIQAGRLVFISDPNASGLNYSSFNFSVGDGVLFSTALYTVTFDVLATNDPPTTGNNTVVTLEDTDYQFTLADFPYADSEGDAIFELRIDALPTGGTLLLGSTPVTLGQTIAIADISGAPLIYRPNPDGSGPAYDSFSFSPSDGTVFSESPGIMSIAVTPVNDAPVLGSIADATFDENVINATPQIIDASSSLPSDIDSTDFDGGVLTISYSAGGGLDDHLSIFDQGTGAGQIGFDGSTVTYGGVVIGSVAISTNGASGNDLLVSLSGPQATAIAVQALLQNLTYANSSNGPQASRTIAVTLIDGDGVLNGGADTSPTELAIISVNPESDTVSIFANVALAAEPTLDGQFTIMLTGVTATDVTVSYSVSGTAASGSDFGPLSGSATILAGTNSVTIDVPVIDDSLVEGVESVIVTLTGAGPDVAIDGSNDVATVMIADEDTAEASIVATTSATEPTTDGLFTVSLSLTSATDTVIAYTIAGDASAGNDYVALSGTVTILAGQTTATIDVSVLDDVLLEDDELVTVTLTTISTGDPDIGIGAMNTASVTIADSDTGVVTIVANDPTAGEPADSGQLTVSLSTVSDTDTVVNYSVGGTAVAGFDYSALSGSVTILAGQTSATIDVNVIDAAALEADESVVVSLTSIASGDADITIGSPNTATVTIVDDDVAEISISANDGIAGEPADHGQFTVTQSATSLVDTIVAYSLSGTAANGIDFSALTGSVTIAAGTTTALIDITVLNDSLVELTESVTITLDTITAGASALFIGAANADSVTITDDDSAIVTLNANDATAAEPNDDGQFTVALSNASGSDTIISYTIGGTATAGSDFVPLIGTVTITAGNTSALIDVSVVDTGLLEAAETVTVTLGSVTSGDADIAISGMLNSDTVTISDDDTAEVSIVVNTSAAEPTTDGQFTVVQSNPSDTDTTISYSIGGTAIANVDYTMLSGSVTILAGATSATIDVSVIEDALLEGDETVVVTLTGVTSGDADVSIATANSATMTLADDDTAEVSIVATDSTAAEPGDDGQFTVSLSRSSGTDTVIAFTVGGNATSTSDFVPLSGTVTILANQLSALIDVSIIDDSILEGAESLTITLNSVTSGNPAISISTSNVASVSIADDDSATVSIAANDSVASEPADDGQFTVTLSSVSDSDTVISYSVSGDATSGSDFAALAGSVTILAGNTSATIDIATLDDSILEDNESVTLTLSGIVSGDSEIAIGASSAVTVVIADNDSAELTITANDSSASEPADNGQFTVQLSTPADTNTVVAYSVSGTAAAGSDYAGLSGTVTILAGNASATIDLSVLDDAIVEQSESITITLTSIVSGDADISIGTTNTATVTLADNDVATVSIAANDPTAAEPGDNGQFTVTLTNASDQDTTLSYNVTGTATAGTDYSSLTGTVTFAAGATSATIDVSTLNDTLVEGSESISVTLTSVTGGDADVSIGTSNVATVNISDDDAAVITIAANDASAAEPSDPGQFVLTLSSASSTDTLVNYVVTGTANSGADFVALSGTATILAGNLTATVDLVAVDDAILESDESVTVSLSGITSGDPDITIGAIDSATVMISDDDTAIVTVTASDSVAAEPSDNGQFLVQLTAAVDVDTVIAYSLSGSATAGSDFATLSGTVTILAGNTTATIEVSVLDDLLLEQSESISVTLTSIVSGDANISIGVSNTATVTLNDDDVAVVSINANDPLSAEPGNDGQFTVTLTNPSDRDTTISYTVTGSAMAGIDYSTLTGTATILAGTTSETIDVLVINDVLLEGSETITVTLGAITSGDVDITIGPSDSATVTINDDDTAAVTIVAADPSAAEPGDAGQFVLSLSNASDTDTTVAYSVTGSATGGVDFVALTGTATILAGNLTATIDITVLDDAILEATESVSVTLTGVTSGDADITIGAANSATVSIDDNDSAVVTISVSDAAAAEPSDDGHFTVQLSAAADVDTVVAYSVTGTATSGIDFSTLSGTVTISAGATTATIDIAVLDDVLVEQSESISVALDSIVAGDADVTIGVADNATLFLADDDVATVSIVANDSLAAEPTNNGQFTVSLTNPSDQDTTLSYTVAGSAAAGNDYSALTGTVKILAGTTSATIDVLTIDDALIEGSELVTVTIDSVTVGDANISIGAVDSATVTIDDDDTAEATIVAADPMAAEPGDLGQFVLSLSNASDTDTTVAYNVSGSATGGADFVALTGTATILAGDLTVNIDIAVLDDTILEATESLSVTLTGVTSGDADITIGAANSATVSIVDNDSAIVTISVTDAATSEPSDDGQFTVQLSSAADVDTVVAYSVTGAATSGTDYAALTGSVTILAGATTATIDVAVLDDLLVEQSESISVTLDSIVAGDADITIGAANNATLFIADNDLATVSIVANDSSAAEPINNGQFTVSLTNPSDQDTTLTYTVAGTATAGNDYSTLTGTVTILAGATSASIDVLTIDDALIENSETVTVTLNSVTTGDADISIGAVDSATVTIDDDDVAEITITASDAAAAEPNNSGQFVVGLSALSTTDTTVSYMVSGSAISGSDFVSLPGSVTILAGNSSATIDLTAIDDAIVESMESVSVTVTAITSGDPDVIVGAANVATVTIDDDDSATVSIIAIDSTAAEPSDNGQFIVQLSAAADVDTVIAYTVTGSATTAVDFVGLSGTVTVLAGNTTAIIDVTVLDDVLVEQPEHVTVTLTSIVAGDADVSTGATNVATVSLADDDAAVVSIIANDAFAAEPADQGQFTVTMTNPSDRDTTVSYSVTGTANAGSDYVTLSGTITIFAGTTTSTIDVSTLDDSLIESSESVTITLNAVTSGDVDISVGASNTATVTINDDDAGTVSIVASDATASEPNNPGQFTLMLSNASTTDTTVSYVVTGTAIASSDFVTLSGSATILAGDLTTTIDVIAIDDTILEGDESVTVTLDAITFGDASLSIGTSNSDTVNILDDDSAELTIVATDGVGGEPNDDGQFTVSLSMASDTDTVVQYLVSGDAVAGSDYASLPGTVTILAGNTSAILDVSVLNDGLLEDDETVTVTLDSIASGDVDVALAAANSATVIITDNDSGTVGVTANDASAAEPGDNGQFTVSLSSVSDTDTTISYVVTGSATAGTDFAGLSGSVTVLAGVSSTTIDVAIIDDSVLESTDTLILTLTTIASGDVDLSIDPANDAATLTITDDDSAEVSIVAVDPNASEPSDAGQIEVTLSSTSDTDTVVAFTIAGDATAGGDFSPLAGTVTIIAGSSSAIIDVLTLDDNLLEDTEQVTVSLGSILSGNPNISVGTTDTATVLIADNDAAVVGIVASDATSAEPTDNGQFTITLSNPSDTDTVIGYTISGTASGGTDYTALTGSVTIAAGSTLATIDVNTIDDGQLEITESITVTLSSVIAGDSDISIDLSGATATVMLADDDTAEVSIVATDPTAAEPGDSGQFEARLSAASASDTIINYSIAGTAVSGIDFTPLTGSVTIAAGTTSATIDISVIDDSLLEESESIEVTLSAVASGDADISIGLANTATVFVSDNDNGTISISAIDDTLQEPTNNGQFEVRLSDVASTDTTVSYSVAGTAMSGIDFAALSGSVTIAAGQNTALIDVLVVNDAVLESDETIELTLTSITSGDPDYSIDPTLNAATATIVDEDSAVATVTASDGSAMEPSDGGQFTIELSAASSTDITFTYQVIPATGPPLAVANPGTDYTPLTGTATILAGDLSVAIDVPVIDDAILEADETITIRLVSSDEPSIVLDMGEATVIIGDDDTASVSIAANDPAAGEPSDDGQFTVTLSSAADTDTTITYAIGGTANGTDFVPLSGTATIAAGTTTATIDVSIIDDAILEANETVVATLTGITSGDANIVVDSANAVASVTVSDDDTALLRVTASDPVAAEPTDNGSFTVSLSNTSDSDTFVDYSITGTANSGLDFVAFAGSVTIVAGDTTATINVTTLDDSVLESTEALTLTLNSVTSGDADISIDPTSASATVMISDNDTATVSIAANDSTAAEPNDNGQFTLTLSNASDSDTVVSYTVAGSATSGTDYVALSGMATIAAGMTSTVIDVTVLDDSVLEGAEIVQVSLDSILSGNSAIAVDGSQDIASITITDDDAATVSIAVTDATLAEPGDDGQFTVQLSSIATSDTSIAYTVGGTAVAGADFSALSGEVTILAGQTSATIDIAVINDSILEGDDTLSITLDTITAGDPSIAIDAANSTGAVTILDDDNAMISIAAADSMAGEPTDTAQFVLTLSAPADTDTVVAYAVTGSATAGADYVPLSGTITIAAGDTVGTIDILPADDSFIEMTETLTVSLTAIISGDADVQLDAVATTSTVSLTDDDSAVASISTVDGTAAEPGNSGQFQVSLSSIADTDTIITYSVSGTASNGSDVDSLMGTVTVRAGDSIALIGVAVIDDTTFEPTETLQIELLSTSNASIGIDATNATATAILLDDDNVTPLDLTAATDTGVSNSDNITSDNTPTFVVPAGTATPGDTVTVFANGQVVGSTTVAADGSFVVTTTTLADGNYDMQYFVTDGSGVNSELAPSLDIVVDTMSPQLPTVNPQQTNDSTPIVTGSAVVDNGKVLQVELNGHQYVMGDGHLTVDSSGIWRLSVPNDQLLTDGTYEVRATLVDLAGNSTEDATVAELVIDTAPPTVDDRTTNDITPTLTGTGSPGELLTISVDVNSDGVAESVYQTTVDGLGQWRVDPDSQTPVIGTFPMLGDDDRLMVIATDPAGNTSTGTIIIDIRVPQVDDHFTDDATAILTGRGEPGEILIIEVDADNDGTPEVTYRTSVNVDGTWLIDPDIDLALTGTFPIVTGNTTLLVTAVDSAGNQGTGQVQIVPPSASISGRVYVDSNTNRTFDADETALEGVLIQLRGVTATGNAASIDVLTNADGSYRFDTLYSGTYEIIQQQPNGFVDGAEVVASQGTVIGNDRLEVTLAPAESATGLSFTEGNLLSTFVSKRWFLTSTGSGAYEDINRVLGTSPSNPPSSSSPLGTTQTAFERVDRPRNQSQAPSSSASQRFDVADKVTPSSRWAYWHRLSSASRGDHQLESSKRRIDQPKLQPDGQALSRVDATTHRLSGWRDWVRASDETE